VETASESPALIGAAVAYAVPAGASVAAISAFTAFIRLPKEVKPALDEIVFAPASIQSQASELSL
jgi:uncharacterized membrane protein